MSAEECTVCMRLVYVRVEDGQSVEVGVVVGAVDLGDERLPGRLRGGARLDGEQRVDVRQVVVVQVDAGPRRVPQQHVELGPVLAQHQASAQRAPRRYRALLLRHFCRVTFVIITQ